MKMPRSVNQSENKFIGNFKQIYAEIRDAGTTIGTSLWMGQSALEWNFDGNLLEEANLAAARLKTNVTSSLITLTTRDESTLQAVKTQLTAYLGTAGNGQFGGEPVVVPQPAQTINGFAQGIQYVQNMGKYNTKLYTWNRKLEYELVNDNKYNSTLTLFYFVARRNVDMEEMRHNLQSIADLDILCTNRRYAQMYGQAGDREFNLLDSMPVGNQGYLGEVHPKTIDYPEYHQHLEWTPHRSHPFCKYFKIYKVKKINMSPGSILKFNQTDARVLTLDPKSRWSARPEIQKFYYKGTKGCLFKMVGQPLSGNIPSGVDLNSNVVTTAPCKMTLKTTYSFKYKNVTTAHYDKFWNLTANKTFRTAGTKSATDQFDIYGDSEITPI